MPAADREALRGVMFSAQMALGWCFPNAIMQYALPALEELTIDQSALARRRDLLVRTLSDAGYGVLQPEGTFYLWSKWPAGDPERLWNALADRDVFVLPGRSSMHRTISASASRRPTRWWKWRFPPSSRSRNSSRLDYCGPTGAAPVNKGFA